MNPLSSLLETYQLAEKSGLVDQHLGETDPILLPIFHDSKKSKGEDAIEVLLDEKGKFLGARFLPKDVYLEFPVSELSIGRSRNIAPQPLVDNLLYLSKSISVAQKKGGTPSSLSGATRDLGQIRNSTSATFVAQYCDLPLKS